MKKIIVLLSLLSCACQGTINPKTVEEFIVNTAKNNNLNEQSVRNIISQAKHQPGIIEAMNRPAEKQKAWHEYRNIFIQQKRIDAGVVFWQQHQQTLEKVSQDSGVPIEIMVAIIGVETNYGSNMGSYRVLDALYTLAFDYPKRATFFTKELEKFLLLTELEKISVTDTKGSYAGAMGYGQFMPSSYLMYARDYDQDGSRDLLNNVDDAIASVGNYFNAHGWQTGAAITYQASTDKTFTKLEKQQLKPSLSVKQLKTMGYTTAEKLDEASLVSLTQLQQKDAMEYWFGLHNFYVITRYNHSEMYTMAVYQLAQAISQAHSQAMVQKQQKLQP